jgi:predicted MPP superfamily phosphohydrolase
LLGMAYRHILKLVGPFDDGLHHHIFWKVYVSSWLGEVGMPWRLGSRPRIDIIYV